MESTIGQNTRAGLAALEAAKARVPEGFEELFDLIAEAYARIDAADTALMELSKAINPEPRSERD
jgi:hypothetical protein